MSIAKAVGKAVDDIKKEQAKLNDADAASSLSEDGLRRGILTATRADWREAMLTELISRYTAPIAMVLFCPLCTERHIDKGKFETHPHHTHACQHCGHVWRPAKVNTVGVMFLPGFKDEPTQE